eukprot:6039728-Pyramimonas_sp.AAC.2
MPRTQAKVGSSSKSSHKDKKEKKKKKRSKDDGEDEVPFRHLCHASMRRAPVPSTEGATSLVCVASISACAANQSVCVQQPATAPVLTHRIVPAQACHDACAAC